MVNSNFYGIDAILMQPSTVQAARAANITYATMLFRRAIDRQEVEPVRTPPWSLLGSAAYGARLHEEIKRKFRMDGFD